MQKKTPGDMPGTATAEQNEQNCGNNNIKFPEAVDPLLTTDIDPDEKP